MVREGGGGSEPDGETSGGGDPEDFDETVGEFLRAYPQYNLTHIYQLSFEDGGITIDQFLSLLNTHVKKETQDKKFLAQIITGINFDEKETKEEASAVPQQSQEFVLFGDPEQYKNMSKDQKKKLTQEMKKQHHMWYSHKLSKSRSIGS